MRNLGLGNSIAIRHTLLCHDIERTATNERLSVLCSEQASAQAVSKDGFYAEYGGFRQRTLVIIGITFPSMATMPTNIT